MASIMVVDDEQEIAAAICAILEDEGHKVEVCRNGLLAWERLRQGTAPQLVLSDVMMPNLSGFELLERVRGDARLESLPVILMSAINPSKTRAEAGWSDFLKKPFNLDTLLDAVERQIQQLEAK